MFTLKTSQRKAISIAPGSRHLTHRYQHATIFLSLFITLFFLSLTLAIHVQSKTPSEERKRASSQIHLKYANYAASKIWFGVEWEKKNEYFNPAYYVHRLNQFSNALWLSENPGAPEILSFLFLSSQITNNNRLVNFFFFAFHFNFFLILRSSSHRIFIFFSSFQFYKSNWFNGREREREMHVNKNKPNCDMKLRKCVSNSHNLNKKSNEETKKKKHSALTRRTRTENETQFALNMI